MNTITYTDPPEGGDALIWRSDGGDLFLLTQSSAGYQCFALSNGKPWYPPQETLADATDDLQPYFGGVTINGAQ